MHAARMSHRVIGFTPGTYDQARTAATNRPVFFGSFGYSGQAHHECAVFYRRTVRLIKLLTVREILDEENVHKM